MKKIIFASGLPRSGSTWALSVLNQNPAISVTGTSALPMLLNSTKTLWWGFDVVRAMEESESIAEIRAILRGILLGAHERFDTEIVINKSRAWPALIETLEDVLQQDVRILAFVRSVREIIASFEKLHRKSVALGATAQQLADPLAFATIDRRAQYWTSNTALLGAAYEVLKDAIARGHRDKILFVKYVDLIDAPHATFERIYKHIGIKRFEHDFDHVEQAVKEYDMQAYRFAGLHDVRSERATATDPAEILGPELAERFAGYEDWWN